jgi:hypothetical protein
MDFEKFANEVTSLGFPLDPVIEFIKTLYVVRELPYERSGQRLLHVEDWVVNLLRTYNLIPTGMSETTVYGKIATIRYYKLTPKGLTLGSQILQRHIRDVIDELLGVLSRYPPGLIRVLALSAIDLREGRASWIDVKVDGWDLDMAFSRTFLGFEMLVTDPQEFLEVYMNSKRLFGDLRLVFERLRQDRAKMYKPRVYDVFMSKVLAEYSGEIHKKALNLMAELSELGLAGRVPVFTRKGEYFSDAYRAPPEVAYILEEYSSNVYLDEARKLFLAAELMLRAARGKLTKRELLAALSGLGVSEEEVKIALEITYGQGITSRYNEAGGPDSPAFLVLDYEGAKSEAERAVKLVEALILSEKG